MSALSLAHNVHSKLLVEFDSNLQVSNKPSEGAVEAMLCGFILEGEATSFDTLSDGNDNSSNDWYYNL